MAAIVAKGGYGSYPIQDLDANYTPGDVYYLARIDGAIDDSLAQALAAAGARIRYVFPEIGVVSLVSPPAAVDAVSQLSQVSRIDLDRPLAILRAHVRL